MNEKPHTLSIIAHHWLQLHFTTKTVFVSYKHLLSPSSSCDFEVRQNEQVSSARAYWICTSTFIRRFRKQSLVKYMYSCVKKELTNAVDRSAMQHSTNRNNRQLSRSRKLMHICSSLIRTEGIIWYMITRNTH